LGKITDHDKKTYAQKRVEATPEKLVLDFGDAFVIHKHLEEINFSKLLKNVFGEYADFVQAMVMYRLCYPSAMRHAEEWFTGSYARLLYPKASLKGQRISECLASVGSEPLLRAFFQEYFKNFALSNQGLVIDGSSLPNQIHIPLSQWGRSGEEIDVQIRFLLAVDKKTGEPLFFRYVPGSIVDVSTLITTLAELKNLGVTENYVFFDAGFVSEDNVNALYLENVDFLTRLPRGRVLYEQLVSEHCQGLENVVYGVKYGKRGLFVKKVPVEFYGHKAFAFLVLDPERKGRETKRLLVNLVEDAKAISQRINDELKDRGVMVLVSSFDLPTNEVVPAYYIRQTAEAMFGFSKDDLNILPLRVHGESTLRGFLLIQFLALIAYVKLKNGLRKKFAVEELILAMRNLKCKVYEKEVVVLELTKRQKQLTEVLNITVPKTAGI
jgi:transposase